MIDLVVYGAGPFARLMHYYFSHDSGYRVRGFTADRPFLESDSFCGLPAVAFEEVESAFPPGRTEMFVAIGYRRMRNRRAMFERAKARGYRLASYIAGASMAPCETPAGENNVVMPGVQIEPFTRIGDNNVFWSGTLVCHDAVIGNHNYFGARCVIGGASTVGDGCFLGNGAILINALRLADETQMLPGAVALADTRRCRKYAGNPAREAGAHEEEGIVIGRG